MTKSSNLISVVLSIKILGIIVSFVVALSTLHSATTSNTSNVTSNVTSVASLIAPFLTASEKIESNNCEWNDHGMTWYTLVGTGDAYLGYIEQPVSDTGLREFYWDIPLTSAPPILPYEYDIGPISAFGTLLTNSFLTQLVEGYDIYGEFFNPDSIVRNTSKTGNQRTAVTLNTMNSNNHSKNILAHIKSVYFVTRNSTNDAVRFQLLTNCQSVAILQHRMKHIGFDQLPHYHTHFTQNNSLTCIPETSFSEYTVPRFWMNIYLLYAFAFEGVADLIAAADVTAALDIGGDVMGAEVGNVVGPVVVMPG